MRFGQNGGQTNNSQKCQKVDKLITLRHIYIYLSLSLLSSLVSLFSLFSLSLCINFPHFCDPESSTLLLGNDLSYKPEALNIFNVWGVLSWKKDAFNLNKGLHKRHLWAPRCEFKMRVKIGRLYQTFACELAQEGEGSKEGSCITGASQTKPTEDTSENTGFSTPQGSEKKNIEGFINRKCYQTKVLQNKGRGALVGYWSKMGRANKSSVQEEPWRRCSRTWSLWVLDKTFANNCTYEGLQ